MTMHDLVRHEYNGKPVRSMLVDGQPWFVAADICGVLGIENVSDALSKLFEDDLGLTEVTDSTGRQRSTRIVNEGGMYMLIMRSRKPEAEAFQRWVTHEVLPAIRKTGVYQQQPKGDQSLQVLVQSTKALAAMAEQLLEVGERIALIEDKVSAFDTLDVEGDDRARLRHLVQGYADKAGISIAKAWVEFRQRWDDAYGERITARMKHYRQERGLQSLTAPEYLEAVKRMPDALRVAGKMLDSVAVRRAA